MRPTAAAGRRPRDGRPLRHGSAPPPRIHTAYGVAPQSLLPPPAQFLHGMETETIYIHWGMNWTQCGTVLANSSPRRMHSAACNGCTVRSTPGGRLAKEEPLAAVSTTKSTHRVIGPSTVEAGHAKYGTSTITGRSRRCRTAIGYSGLWPASEALAGSR